MTSDCFATKPQIDNIYYIQMVTSSNLTNIGKNCKPDFSIPQKSFDLDLLQLEAAGQGRLF